VAESLSNPSGVKLVTASGREKWRITPSAQSALRAVTEITVSRCRGAIQHHHCNSVILTLSSRSMKRLSPREFWDEILMISTFVWIKKRIQTKVVFY
jgi:hypothetical protein